MLLGLCLLLASAAAHAETVAELRAARRAAMRAAIQAKDGTAVGFGLLVIPVDFSDARFPPDFSPARDLLPRLTGDQAGTLSHYFHVASRGRTALVVQVAPRVSLPGSRLDYSDRYWQGYERSRLMARLALEHAAAFAADFAAADLDRDGEVDGVLLLHAAAGAENDPDGLILPLQHYLATPVGQRGNLARSYAVAAARSSLGLWAHETGHLLGLEDRYDFGFGGGGDVAPRGGLGRFSLMAAGWSGSGQGEDPALPDAYSCLQLGWVDLGARPGPATVVRLDYREGPGPQFFLAEQRYPELMAPYDAALPAQRLLLLHIDETLAEGQASSVEFPARHLRVNLVQADGSDTVARGSSQGRGADLFPTDGSWQTFDDATLPAALAFDGRPTAVSFTAAVNDGRLEFAAAGAAASVDLRLVFVAAGGVITPRVLARVLTAGDLPDDLAVTIVCASTVWGSFAGGTTLATTLERCAPAACGWPYFRDAGLPPWLPAAAVPPDAVTDFTYTVDSGPGGIGGLAWPWHLDAAPLALDGAWPGAWRIGAHDTDSTRWQRWLDGPGGSGVMLACTGADHETAAAWPQVAYGGRAHAVLQSPLLGIGVRWVALTHAIDLELLYPGLAMDAVGLTWRHANGRAVVPAEPVDGWLGGTYSKARHPLSGRSTFAVADPLRGAEALPLWRREVLPLPDVERYGPGPWRLQLELASDAVEHGRGWLVRNLAGHTSEPPTSAFPVQRVGDRLQWTWSGGDPVVSCTVEVSEDGGATWDARVADLPVGGEGELPLGALGLRAGQRTLARVLAHAAQGTMVSRSVPLVAERLPELGAPRPNPGGEVVQLAVDAAGDERAMLSLHDLRGRKLREWRPGGDVRVLAWDGTDAAGRPVAAGVYLFRLLALDRVQTRKVTWLP